MEKKIIRVYVLCTVLFKSAMAFHFATYVIFLRSCGMNLFEVNLINTIFMLTMFFGEIPTGALADAYGRKKSFLAACGFTTLGMTVYFFARSFPWFVCAEIFAAIGSICATGAFQAWMVDALYVCDASHSVSPTITRAEQWSAGVSMGASVGGAYLAVYNLAIPWIMGAVVACITGIITFFFMEEIYYEKNRKVYTWRDAYSIFCESIKYARFHTDIWYVFCMTFLVSLAVQPFNMYWQPFFEPFFKNRFDFGWCAAGISVTVMCGAMIARLYTKKRTHCSTHFLFILQCVTGCMMVCAALMTSIINILIFFFLHETMRGIIKPMKDIYLNDRVPCASRATLLSCDATAGHIGAMLGLFTSGIVAQVFSIRTSWISFGSILILIPFFIALLLRSTVNRK